LDKHDARMTMKDNDASPDGPVIIRFRKDLRLDDNRARHFATQCDAYVKTVLPKLKDLPAKFNYRPFSVLKAAGAILGRTYPKPLVDHARARERALLAYGKIKDAV